MKAGCVFDIQCCLHKLEEALHLTIISKSDNGDGSNNNDGNLDSNQDILDSNNIDKIEWAKIKLRIKVQVLVGPPYISSRKYIISLITIFDYFSLLLF